MNNTKKMRWILLAVLSLVLLAWLVVIRCDLQKVADPESVSLFKSSYYGMTLHDGNGIKHKDVFYRHETLFFLAEALKAQSQCDIQVIRVSDEKIIRRAIVMPDHETKINSIPLWYDIGTDEQGREVNLEEDYVVHFIRPRPEPRLSVIIPFKVINTVNPEVPNLRGYYVDDGTAIPIIGSVLKDKPVYVEGSGFPKNTEVHLYVVADKRDHLEGNPFLEDVTGDGIETVNTDADGSFARKRIWNSASLIPGSGFDIVADLAPFKKYNQKDGLAEALLTGFVIQEPATAADIVTELACDASGAYKAYFDPTEAIYVWTNPSRQPLNPNHEAAVYIVNHQDVWAFRDPLVAMPFETTQDMPFYMMDRHLCGNIYPFNIVSRQTAHGTRNLFPGRYDVVVDIGRNGIYDPGTDLLDGGSQPGFMVPGIPPDILLIATANSDFLLPGETGLILVKLIRGDDGSSIIGAPVTLEIIDGPGSLSITNTKTSPNGLAQSQFFGGGMDTRTVIEVTAEVDGKIYKTSLSVYIKFTYPHDQGTFGGR